MVRIAHCSDLHGDWEFLDSVKTPDLWVFSGDFFPNRTRGIRPIESSYQEVWFRRAADRLVCALRGVPVVVVDGNHDFVNLAPLLASVGVESYDVASGPVDIKGLRFSGFPYIPWIIGEWNYEEDNIQSEIDRVWAEDPDVLLTHAPPAGILAKEYGYSAISSALFYREHKIRYHLFGHIHACGGQIMKEGGIVFSNAATTCNILDLDPRTTS